MQMEPWLLEVNLSPACEERTDWMSDYVQQMAEGMLRLVLSNNLLPHTKNDEHYLNHWRHLIRKDHYNGAHSNRSRFELPTTPRTIYLIRRLQLRYRLLSVIRRRLRSCIPSYQRSKASASIQLISQ